jgi:hypothetical protein
VFERLYARELLADQVGGVGYLLKDRMFHRRAAPLLLNHREHHAVCLQHIQHDRPQADIKAVQRARRRSGAP